jgi:hypothetical protein
MRNQECSVALRGGSLVAVLAAVWFVGCQSDQNVGDNKPVAAANGPMTSVVAATPPAPAPVTSRPTIRINAAATAPFTDSSGNVWLPDQGFTGGDIVDRGSEMAIANTPDPALYRTERYSMTAFSQPLPNGKYLVKLHFAETFEDISGAGERVFSFNVEGHVLKDFDVFAKAGGKKRAYIETVPVEVADGKLDIVFTSQVQNPEINGIEIIPAL